MSTQAPVDSSTQITLDVVRKVVELTQIKCLCVNEIPAHATDEPCRRIATREFEYAEACLTGYTKERALWRAGLIMSAFYILDARHDIKPIEAALSADRHLNVYFVQYPLLEQTLKAEIKRKSTFTITPEEVYKTIQCYTSRY